MWKISRIDPKDHLEFEFALFLHWFAQFLSRDTVDALAAEVDSNREILDHLTPGRTRYPARVSDKGAKKNFRRKCAPYKLHPDGHHLLHESDKATTQEGTVLLKCLMSFEEAIVALSDNHLHPSKGAHDGRDRLMSKLHRAYYSRCW